MRNLAFRIYLNLNKLGQFAWMCVYQGRLDKKLIFLAILQLYKLPLTFFLISKIPSTLLNLTTISKLALELIYDAQERS